jgi:predicted dehydrogenase
MSRLRIAVVGAGNIAQQHLPVLSNHPDCQVALLCDPNAATRAQTAERFEIGEQAETVEQALARDDIDAVFVLVSVLHVARVAGASIAAGMPTFLEKPPGIYSSETARLAELQQRHGTVAMVGLNRRFYSSHLAARERLLARGPIVSVTVDAHEDLARASREKFSPLVLRRWAYANGIHALDLLRFFGGDVAEVDAWRSAVENDFPDSYTARLRFGGGALGRAAVDWFAPGRHRFEVRGIGACATSRPDWFDYIHRTRIPKAGQSRAVSWPTPPTPTITAVAAARSRAGPGRASLGGVRVGQLAAGFVLGLRRDDPEPGQIGRQAPGELASEIVQGGHHHQLGHDARLPPCASTTGGASPGTWSVPSRCTAPAPRAR